MPSVRSLADLAALLQAKLATLPEAEHRGLDKGTAYLLERTREIPGHYQDGWPQLAESTQADRVKKGFTPNDPLKRTGALAESYERTVLSHTEAAVGSNLDLAEYHEAGTSKMPPRPVLGASLAQNGQATADKIGAVVAKHIAGRG